MKIFPENILRLMSEKDRKALGPGGRTASECRDRFQRGEEKKLQKVVADFLNLKEIYFEVDRMDKRTSGKPGRPDFRICYRGRWLAVECKAEGGVLSPEQRDTLEKVRKSGGVAIVAFGLDDVRTALRDMEGKA